jgi:uncharacterized protein (TIGR00725 family)
VAVVGAGRATTEHARLAEEVGRGLAEAGALVVCGGLGGVMEAACRGAKGAGGATLGILPGSDRSQANAFVDVAVATGLGEARNAIVVRAADALIAVAGEYGTLSEIALALKTGKPVVGLESWDIDGVVVASSPADAVSLAVDRANKLAQDRLDTARGRPAKPR